MIKNYPDLHVYRGVCIYFIYLYVPVCVSAYICFCNHRSMVRDTKDEGLYCFYVSLGGMRNVKREVIPSKKV